MIICILGECYILLDQTLRWDEAEIYCNDNYNSSLATIYTPQQNKIVTDLCLSIPAATGCWIGLYQPTPNSNWYWKENNLTAAYTYWAQVEPNGGDTENCAEIMIDVYFSNQVWTFPGQWNDQNCSGYAYPICNEPIKYTGK